VSEGEQVTKGQVLAKLGDRESYQASISAAQLELTLAQQAVDDLERTTSLAYQQARWEVAQAEAGNLDAEQRLEEIDTDETQKKIDDANVKLSNEEDDLQDAQDEFDKYADLDADNPDRKNAEQQLEDAQLAYDQAERERDRLVNELEQARADAALSNARLQEAKFRLEQRTDGPDQQELAAAEARLVNAQAQLAAAEAAMANLNLMAPYDGTIVKVNIAVGETALPNRTVMVIADMSEWYVETTDLTENEVVSIELGQTALVVPDALPDLEMTGNVESISQAYQEIAGDITYEVRLLLTDPDPQIRWGMTVEVTFNGK
jgi:multidrug resistance efflux pump